MRRVGERDSGRSGVGDGHSSLDRWKVGSPALSEQSPKREVGGQSELVGGCNRKSRKECRY